MKKIITVEDLGVQTFFGNPGDEISYENAPEYIVHLIVNGQPVDKIEAAKLDLPGHLGGSTGWAAGHSYVGFDHFRLSDKGDYFVSRDELLGGTETWVTGGAGNDILMAGSGIDHFDGGGQGGSSPLFPQGDMLSYTYARGPVILSIDGSIKGGAAANDTWVNIESIGGGEFDDELYSIDDGADHLLIGDASEGYNLTTHTGADKLYGARNNDHRHDNGDSYFDTYIPEGGSDEIHLGARGNWIDYESDPHTGGTVVDLLNPSLNTGDAAGDTYYAFDGHALNASDTVALNLTGSDHNDSLSGTNGANHILGDPLPGVNYTSDGNDLIHGQGGNDWLEGIGGADTLYGDDGNDKINGGLGADTLWGGTGADTFIYADTAFHSGLQESTAAGYDIIHDFESGTDHLDVSAVASITSISMLSSGGGTFLFSNTVDGAYLEIGSTAPIQGSDLVIGAGVTTINMVGDAGFNILIGGGLNDTIQGGGGGDWLAGGGGADRFIFTATTDSTMSAADSIFDFQTGVDKIDLRALHIGATSVNWLSSGGSSYVFIDANLDGANDMLLQLSGAASLSTSDFLL